MLRQITVPMDRKEESLGTRRGCLPCPVLHQWKSSALTNGGTQDPGRENLRGGEPLVRCSGVSVGVWEVDPGLPPKTLLAL